MENHLVGSEELMKAVKKLKGIDILSINFWKDFAHEGITLFLP